MVGGGRVDLPLLDPNWNAGKINSRISPTFLEVVEMIYIDGLLEQFSFFYLDTVNCFHFPY